MAVAPGRWFARRWFAPRWWGTGQIVVTRGCLHIDDGPVWGVSVVDAARWSVDTNDEGC